jgi:hypothetical protein
MTFFVLILSWEARFSWTMVHQVGLQPVQSDFGKIVEKRKCNRAMYIRRVCGDGNTVMLLYILRMLCALSNNIDTAAFYFSCDERSSGWRMLTKKSMEAVRKMSSLNQSGHCNE